MYGTVNNAKRFQEVQKEFGTFDKYIWQFTGNKVINNKYKTHKNIQPFTKESDAMSADLYKRGFKFVGSTIKLSTGITIRTPVFHFNNDTVWGATAMMLSEFKSVLFELGI